MAAVCHFPTLENAVQTAQQVIQYGIPIARIEMLNKDQMGISIRYSKLKDIEEEKVQKGPSTVNNSVFFGSTAELQKMLKQKMSDK